MATAPLEVAFAARDGTLRLPVSTTLPVVLALVVDKQ
jgi:hypothetical protein